MANIAKLVKQPTGLTFAATEESQAQTDLIHRSSGVNPARGIHKIMRIKPEGQKNGIFYTVANNFLCYC